MRNVPIKYSILQKKYSNYIILIFIIVIIFTIIMNINPVIELLFLLILMISWFSEHDIGTRAINNGWRITPKITLITQERRQRVYVAIMDDFLFGISHARNSCSLHENQRIQAEQWSLPMLASLVYSIANIMTVKQVQTKTFAWS